MRGGDLVRRMVLFVTRRADPRRAEEPREGGRPSFGGRLMAIQQGQI